MSISINSLTFTGRVGSVFSVKKFNDRAILEFTVAVRPNYKNKNGEYDTQWYYCKVWDKPECSYINMLSSQLVKGGSVTCIGTLDFDPVTGGPKLFTGNDGTWKAVFSVNCKDVVVQFPRPGNTANGSNSKSGVSSGKTQEDQFSDMDDIPW